MILNLIGKLWKKMPKNGRSWLTRRIQTKFTVSAAGVITNDHDEVLLLDHLLRPASGWGLPGGFLNESEQAVDAFRREIHEETGLELNDVIMVRISTLDRHIEVIFTAKAVGEAVVKSPEIKGLGWFAYENLPRDLSPDQETLVRQALRHY